MLRFSKSFEMRRFFSCHTLRVSLLTLLAGMFFTSVYGMSPVTVTEEGDASTSPSEAASLQTLERRISNYLREGVNERRFPGCQLVIGTSQKIIYSANVGSFDYVGGHKVDNDDLYDLASITKVMSTTVAFMRLYGEGAIRLTDRLGSVATQYASDPVGDLTMRELLTHTSGMKPVIYVCELVSKPLCDTVKLLSAGRDSLHPIPVDAHTYIVDTFTYNRRYVSDFPDEETLYRLSPKLWVRAPLLDSIDAAVKSSFTPYRRGRFKYSCLNFYLLQKAIEARSGMPLDKYVDEIYTSMGLSHIGYKPLEWSSVENIAPTEYDVLLRRDTVRGYVHDEMSAALGGVCGNAGLFADASDVGEMCRMFLNNGRYKGRQIIKSDVIKLFTSNQMPSSRFIRGLGFDKLKKEPYSESSFGHTGFTGTYFWCDPSKDLFVVLLTNGVYPSRVTKSINGEYRGRLWKLAQELREKY